MILVQRTVTKKCIAYEKIKWLIWPAMPIPPHPTLLIERSTKYRKEGEGAFSMFTQFTIQSNDIHENKSSSTENKKVSQKHAGILKVNKSWQKYTIPAAIENAWDNVFIATSLRCTFTVCIVVQLYNAYRVKHAYIIQVQCHDMVSPLRRACASRYRAINSVECANSIQSINSVVASGLHPCTIIVGKQSYE